MYKLKKVFISRELSDDSIFLQRLNTAGYEVHGETLLTFSPTPFDAIPDSEWLFFYSQKGVQFFFEQYLKNGDTTPFPYKCAAFGPATAAAIRAFEVTPYFIGTGKAESTAKYFGERVGNDHVCFVRAKNSRRSVQVILKEKINIRELIVYNNEYKRDFSLPHFDILVFTSPMNARAYFDQHEFLKDQVVIAIGETTASVLRELDIKCIVSKMPSEEGLADCCLMV